VADLSDRQMAHGEAVELHPSVIARPFVLQTTAVGSGFSLPAGTVTFLLTDIEGSASGWEHDAEAMARAVAHHYDVLDELIAAHGGVRPVEQGEGDSVVAAFGNAGDAIGAALEAQRSLLEVLPELRVRMALHSGDAQLRDEGNYVGRTITRCARLRGCAHGGQILVSDATAAVAADSMPADASLVDLGPVRLRDLTRPERVWQLVHQALPSQFPPLRSLDAIAHNLPIPLSSFVGRESDLATVGGLIQHHRLVTLTGSGGCGKTRLALHTAADLVGLHAGGTWWAELAALTSGDLVPDCVALATGTSPSPGADVLTQVVSHLSQAGAVLVVLDNAEHVVDDAARTSERLLTGCPDLRLLVTSREPLGLPGEVVWRVPSLAAPQRDEPVTLERLDTFDAVQLFLERAREARPNLVVGDPEVAHVAAICARLNGIPLALELAAARTRTLSLEHLATGLNDAFRLLTGGARTALPRQQTLLASIAWSVDLLDAVERAVLRRFAVFQRSFTLDAAEAVGADGELVAPIDVLDVLGRLVDKSLVQLEGSGRYRLLETIRQFASDRLRDAGELAATRDRHAGWFADWCEQVGRGRYGIDPKVCAPEMPDVLAALEWSYETDPTTAYRISADLAFVRLTLGYFDELERQLDWILGRDGTDDPVRWQRALLGLSQAAVWMLRTDVTTVALELPANDDEMCGQFIDVLRGLVSLVAAELGPMERVVAAAVERGQDLILPQTAGLLAFIATRCGDLAVAHAHLDLLYALAERHSAPFSCDTVGHGFLAAIELAIAEGRLDEGRQIATAPVPADNSYLFPVAGAMAQLACLLGDEDLFDRAERWIDRVPPPRMRAFGPYVGFWRAAHERRWVDALDLVQQAWDGNSDNGPAQGVMSPPLVIAALTTGRIGLARQHVEHWATTVADLQHQPRHRAILDYDRAVLAVVAGDTLGAWEHGHQVLEAAERGGYRIELIDALELLAVVADRRRLPVVAARLMACARAERDDTCYVARLAEDLLQIARLEQQLRDNEPDASNIGATIGRDEIVEYARRSRGQRGRPNHGWDSLTPTESRVAALVADGLSNEQIAQRLLMGRTTVKTHLTHIFTKTGAENRSQLTAQYHQRLD
jgi:predicted ATPase/class 3 adenylate cyclase/DNA-binding CsgD family transcriptional regulator